MDLSIFFAYCFFTSCLVAGESPIYGLQGQAVEFTPNISPVPDDILWKHNGNKVLDFNGNEETTYGSFKNRVTLDWHYANLNIEDLTFEDSGDYELEVFTNKVLDRKFYKLQVIDKVAKPTVICDVNKDGGSDESGKHATLMCSAESRQFQSLMTFEWSANGNVLPGQNLTITFGDGRDDEEYTCTVRNPLTTESTVFTAKQCSTDNGESTLLIVVLICLSFLILLLLGALLYFLKLKGRFSTANRADVEKRSLHDDEDNGEVKKVLIDRAPTMPSHQKLDHLNRRKEEDEDDHSELEDSTTEEHAEKPRKGTVRGRVNELEQLLSTGSKKKKARRNLPPQMYASPAVDVSNSQEPVDEDELKEAPKKEDSEKADDALSGAPPESPPPQDFPVNDQEPADEVELKDVTKKEDSEGDSLNSKKANDNFSGEPPKPPSVQDLCVNDQEPVDEGKITEATEKEDAERENHALSGEDTDCNPVASKTNSVLDATENNQESVNELKEDTKKEDTEGKDRDRKSSSPPPVATKRHSVRNPPVNIQEPTDEDELKEATEEKETEGDSMNSKKGDHVLSSKERDRKSSSPPPVAPKRHSVRNPPVNIQEPTDEDELKEATEEKDTEGDSMNSKKGDDVLSGEEKESKVKSPPPVAPKRYSVRNPPVNNQQPADEDKLKKGTEREDSEKKTNALSEADKGENEDAPESDASSPAAQPHSTSTQNTPDVTPDGDADKHKADTSSDKVATVDTEKSVGKVESLHSVEHNKAAIEVQESPSTTA